VVIWVASCSLCPTGVAAGSTGPQKTATEEVRQHFTIDGRPVPPEIFRDFGDGDLADSGAIWVTVDLRAATGSNLYADPIKVDGAWVTQTKKPEGAGNSEESTSYRLIGIAQNGLLVFVAAYNGGGSGTFYTLHTLDVVDQVAFDAEGKPNRRLAATIVQSMPLGDRWNGEVTLQGNKIIVGTTRQGPADDSGALRTTTFEAQRP
jgi:hypothetical protein